MALSLADVENCNLQTTYYGLIHNHGTLSVSTSRTMANDGPPVILTPMSKQLLQRDLHSAGRFLSQRIERYMFEILPRSRLTAQATGARCWSHRQSDKHCTLQQCESTDANDLFIIHWQGLSVAKEPFFRCARAWEHWRKKGHGDRTKTYSAIRHCVVQFPAENSSSRHKRKWCCDTARGSCQLQVRNPYTQQTESVLQINTTHFISLAALTEVNNLVFDSFLASPCMSSQDFVR